MDDPVVSPLLELVGPRHHLSLDVEVSLPGPVLLRRDVVIRGAGLENVDEGETLVLNRPPDQVLEMPDVVGVPPRDEGVARGQREKDRVDALIDVRLREGLRLHPQLERGGGLSLRQAIDAVVEDNVSHIDVPPAGVDEVARAYPHPVTVSTCGDDLEFGVGELDSSGERQRPSVEGVHAVRPDEVGDLPGTAYPRDDYGVARVDAHLGERHLDGVEDAKITTPGTPVVVRLGLEF